MCKKLKNLALPVLAVLALVAFFAGPAFAGGIALTGTRMPAPVTPAPAGQFHSIPLTGTQAVGAINGTQAITGITGQALNGTRPATVNIPVPGTNKSIPLTGTIAGSRATGVIVGVNLFTVKFP